MTIKNILLIAITLSNLMLSPSVYAQSSSSGGAEKAAIEDNKATWSASHVDAQGAYELLISNPQTIVLDIRTSKEISNGYIEGAKFVDFYDDDFAQHLSKLDREAHYIVHCAIGGRSSDALTIFKKLGFTNITHMDGGIRSWKRKKLPLIQKN